MVSPEKQLDTSLNGTTNTRQLSLPHFIQKAIGQIYVTSYRVDLYPVFQHGDDHFRLSRADGFRQKQLADVVRARIRIREHLNAGSI